MKRGLAASLTLLLAGWSPAIAADGSWHESDWHSDAREHDSTDRHPSVDRWAPGFVWLGYRHDPLWSWDDGFFADLQYERDRYGYWPDRRRRHHPSGEVEVVNGQARYHYDRGYPYRHYDYSLGRGDDRRGYGEAGGMHCRTQWVWSDRHRENLPVRICS